MKTTLTDSAPATLSFDDLDDGDAFVFADSRGAVCIKTLNTGVAAYVALLSGCGEMLSENKPVIKVWCIGFSHQDPTIKRPAKDDEDDDDALIDSLSDLNFDEDADVEKGSDKVVESDDDDEPSRDHEGRLRSALRKLIETAKMKDDIRYVAVDKNGKVHGYTWKPRAGPTQWEIDTNSANGPGAWRYDHIGVISDSYLRRAWRTVCIYTKAKKKAR